MSSFWKQYLAGAVALEDIDEFIDRWHQSPSAHPLHTYLGMSREQYIAWLENPTAVQSGSLDHL